MTKSIACHLKKSIMLVRKDIWRAEEEQPNTSLDYNYSFTHLIAGKYRAAFLLRQCSNFHKIKFN